MSEFIDQDVIESLKELGGDEFVQELAVLFSSQSKEIFESIKNAVESKNADILHKSAHKLKGSCLNIGAPKLAEISKTIEAKGKNHDLEGIESLFIEFIDTYDKTMVAFSKYA